MECHPSVVNWESRAGLVMGTRVSLSRGMTITSLVMGQVMGQAGRQALEAGIRRYKAGHRDGCGTAQARPHSEG